MADVAVRCDVTELFVDQCAHCRRLPDPAPRVLGRPFTAAAPGRCVDCDQTFQAGDRIRRDPAEGGYVGRCCSEVDDD